MENGGIPVEFLIFVFLFALVLFYFTFFQQYLTALVYKIGLFFFRPSGYEITFSRVATSFTTGQITFYNVKVVCKDYKIKIGRFCGAMYFWRKVPDFTDIDEDTKDRTNIHVSDLRLTIYNNSEATRRVKTVVNMYNSGKSTEDVSKYIRSLFPEPSKHLISVLFRSILPLRFHIHGVVVRIGNPRLPAFLLTKCESIDGNYTLIPRDSLNSWYKSYIKMSASNISFYSMPQNFDPPPKFSISMREIFTRSKKEYEIFVGGSLDIEIVRDLPKFFIYEQEIDLDNNILNDPILKVNIKVNDMQQPIINYSPYVDKLRKVFQQFYSPFLYNDPIFFTPPDSRIKYCQIRIELEQGIQICSPFFTRNLCEDSAFLFIGANSQVMVHVPIYPSTQDENQFHIDSILNDIRVTTSLCNEIVIKTSLLRFKCDIINPTEWNGIISSNVVFQFQNSNIKLHPYHIEFFADLFTDWNSRYPFQVIEDTVFNFIPFHSNISFEFNPITIRLLSQPIPTFESVNEFDSFNTTDVSADSLKIQVEIPLIHFKDQENEISFSSSIEKPRVVFVHPQTDMTHIRRGVDFHDFMQIPEITLQGKYQYHEQDKEFSFDIKVDRITGTATVYSIRSLLSTIFNYTTRHKKHPIGHISNECEYKAKIPEYNRHLTFNMYLKSIVINIPYDLYDPNECFVAKIGEISSMLEGYDHYWHADLTSPLLTIHLPKTQFPYDNFYNEQLDDVRDQQEGIVYSENIHLSYKAIRAIDPEVSEIKSLFSFQVESITGAMVLPQAMNALEIIKNINFEWFGEDMSGKKKCNLLLHELNVFINDIKILIFFGSQGYFELKTPSGLMVYGDNLIDKDSYKIYYLTIPTVDINYLNTTDINEYGSVNLTSLLRITTYLSIINRTQYDETEKNQNLQNLLLRKHSKIEKLLPFIENKMRNRVERPEMMNKNSYSSCLTSNYRLSELFKPSIENDESLYIPFVEPTSKNDFLSPETTFMFMKSLKIDRFASHSFKIVSKEWPIEPFNLKNPVRMTHVVIPHKLIINSTPPSIAIVASIINSFNSKPDNQLLSAIVRKRIWKEVKKTTNTKVEFSLNIPEINLNVGDESFTTNLRAKSINVIKRKDCKQMTSNSMLSIKSISLNSSVAGSEISLISTKIPKITRVSINGVAKAKVGAFKVKFESGSSQMLNLMIAHLYMFLIDFPRYVTAKRERQFERLIRAHHGFEEEYEKYKKMQVTVNDNPLVPAEANAYLTAIYTMRRTIVVRDFTQAYQFVEIPPPPKKLFVYSTTLVLREIKITISHPDQKKSLLVVQPLPLQIQYTEQANAFTAGFSSLSIHLSPYIISFFADIKIPELPNKIPLPKNSKHALFNIQRDIIVHFSANNLNMTFQLMKFDLQRAGMLLHVDAKSVGIERYSILASARNIKFSISEFLSSKFEGVSLSRSKGMNLASMSVMPIDIKTKVCFLMNPTEFIDLNFINLKKKENENLTKKRNKSMKLLKFMCLFSAILHIDKITINIDVKDPISLEFVIPSSSSLTYAKNKGIITFFTFISRPMILAKPYLDIPYPDVIIQGNLDKHARELWTFVMFGEIERVSNLERMKSVANLLNEFLVHINKKEHESIKTQHKKNKKKIKNANFDASISFMVPKFSVSFPEIQTKLELEYPYFLLEKQKDITWDCEIQNIQVNVIDSSFKVDLKASHLFRSLSLTLSNMNGQISALFFPHLANLNTFYENILEKFKMEKNVKMFLDEMNCRLKEEAIERAEQLLDKIGYNNSEKVDFPSIPLDKFFIEIKDSNMEIKLPSGGNLMLKEPNLQFLYQIRKSNEHDLVSSGVQFTFDNLEIILDTNENDQDKLSKILFKRAQFAAVSFKDQVISNLYVNGLKIQLYPNFPAAFKNSLEAIDFNSKKNESKINLKYEIGINLEQVSIALYPIDNNISIHSINAKLLIDKAQFLISIRIPMKTVANFTPDFIEWLSKFHENVSKIKVQPIKYKTRKEITIICESSPMEIHLHCLEANNEIQFIIGFSNFKSIYSNENFNARLLNMKMFYNSNEAQLYQGPKIYELTLSRTEIMISKERNLIYIPSESLNLNSDKIKKLVFFKDNWFKQINELKKNIKFINNLTQKIEIQLLIRSLDMKYMVKDTSITTNLSSFSISIYDCIKYFGIKSINLIAEGSLVANLSVNNSFVIKYQESFISKLESILLDICSKSNQNFPKSLTNNLLQCKANQIISLYDILNQSLMISGDSLDIQTVVHSVQLIKGFVHSFCETNNQPKKYIKNLLSFHLKANILLNNSLLEVCKNNPSDQEAANLFFDEMKLLFEINEDEEIIKKLKLILCECRLGLKSVHSMRNILKVPEADLSLSTIQNSKNEIEFDFVSSFNDYIESKLNDGDYKIVSEIMKEFFGRDNLNNNELVSKKFNFCPNYQANNGFTSSTELILNKLEADNKEMIIKVLYSFIQVSIEKFLVFLHDKIPKNYGKANI